MSTNGGQNRSEHSDAANRPRFRVKFAWYDLWVGAYIDRAARVLYICPLPMLLVEVGPIANAFYGLRVARFRRRIERFYRRHPEVLPK